MRRRIVPLTRVWDNWPNCLAITSRSTTTTGAVVATVEIYDRCEATVDLDVPNIALAEYRAPENYPVAECPLCKAGVAITRF